MPTDAARRPRIRPRRVLFLALVAVLVVMVVLAARYSLLYASMFVRTTPVYDPPVLAGQYLASGCSGGVYARTADGTIVLTTTGHCLVEGGPAYADGGRFIGKASAWSHWATCDKPDKNRCTASDMAYVPVVPAMIPWGHLDQVDLGAGGYVTIAPGTRPLACADVKPGDPVDFNGHSIHRTGTVIAQEPYDFPPDGTYFPCITISSISGMGGDSGGVVLVRGVPAGVAARVFGGDNALGFTPLAEGLAELGLTMCDTPDCGLTPSTAANARLSPTP